MALFVATPLLAVIVVAVRILYVEPQEARSQWDRRDALAAQEPGETLADPASTVLDPPPIEHPDRPVGPPPSPDRT